MKPSAPLSTEIAAVNKEPEVIDLKRLREAKGLTLKDIFSVTRITVTNLEAIEDGHYDLLPAPVYTRTFIKTYAGILETDSKPLLQQYEKYLQSRNQIHETPEEDHKEPPRKEKKVYNIRLVLWAVAAIALFGLIALIVLTDITDLMNLFSPRHTTPQKTVSPLPERKVPVTPPAVSPTSVVTPSGQRSENQGVSNQIPGQTLNLKIEAVEKTWIRISADQKQPEQIMLNVGDRIERTARESFTVDIGNAGGILVLFQDKPLPPLGKRGEVTHLKLP